MNLIVDIGNSKVKLAVFNQTELVDKVVCEHEETGSALNELLSEHSGFKAAIVGASGATPTGLPELLSQHANTVLQMSHELELPFTNTYSTPTTLGLDRIALISAAANQYPDQNVLVIDAGSCVTYDVLNDQNEYLGGAISPGLRMRYSALHHFTEKLPELEPETIDFLIGNSTKNSIHSGVIQGITKEIDGLIDEYNEQFDDLTVILTGGDLLFLLDHVKNSIFANPNFLLEGLNHILNTNTR